MPPNRKPKGRGSDVRKKPKALDARLTVVGELPQPPRGMLKVSRDQWDEFWASDLGRMASPVTDMPMVVRLFTLYDERERAYRAIRKTGRLVEGSQGQMVLNPLLRHMSTFDAEIRQLEDRVGMSPRSRLNLGIQLGAARRTLDDINREAELADGEGDLVIDLDDAVER